MKDELFSIHFISVQNCFLHFPELWLDKIKATHVTTPVLKLESDTLKCGYFTCSPEPYRTNESNAIGISATYAKCLGLKDNENVTLTLCSNVDVVKRINVSPVTSDDWEILEMSSNLVQSSLLDQVRVVWCNQILVVWISRSLHISLHVDGLESNCAAGLLEPLSDVIIAPPVAKPTLIEEEKMEGNAFNEISEKYEHQNEDFESNKSLTSSLWKSFKSYIFVDSRTNPVVEDPFQTEEEHQSISVLERHKQNPYSVIYRVHPFCAPVSEKENESMDYLLLQPYNVFIRKCCMPLFDNEVINNRKNGLICTLTRIFSPLETEDTANKQSSKDLKLHRPKSSILLPSGTNLCNIHVQLFVIEDIYNNLSERLKEYLDIVTVNKPNGHLSLLVTDVTRSIIGATVGSRVSLEVLPAVSSSSHLSEIQLIPLEKWEKDTKELETLCRVYLADQVKRTCLVINSEAYLPLKGLSCGTFYVFVKLMPVDMKYAVLDPDVLRRCKLSVKENNLNLIYPIIDETVTGDAFMINLSNFKELLTEGVTSMELSLSLVPLITKLLPCKSYMTSNNILITGKAGSGKTTLAEAICRELSKPPHFVHWFVVQCKNLKGKKVETLQKLMFQWLSECMYYQPAILVLDDLDSIAGVGSSSPGNEAAGENKYYTRVGERLNELLEEYQTSNSISVIGIAPSVLKINPSLMAPRGQNIFKTVLEIPELTKNDRMDIVKNIVSNRNDVTNNSSSFKWEKIAGNSEGFVVQDLVDLVDKAVFESCKRSVPECSETSSVELNDTDFEVALKNVIPLSQRGVELYQGESKTWDDVGGLLEVKDVLIEILQWPSQYPDIFANAPLRHQSGVLLYGAPGTGKTLLAGAVAHECGLKFISIKGPELLSKYIGASEEAVRNIFQKAQSAKPCILFFDEFDSLAPRRGHDSTGVTDRVVNQLLTQLDGVESLYGVWVVAATSRPDLIDPALLRPGRLDRILNCPLPDKASRLSILQALSRKLTLSSDVDFEEIADKSEGFTGADLQAVLYTAQLTALEQTIALQGTDPQMTIDEVEVLHNKTDHNFERISGPAISHDNLRTALNNTRPSLSDMEKLKYRFIYEKFERSHGGTSPEDMASMPQRATLA
ncbi:peroxisomal ATPase PEX1 isoform X2 [Periplaneta americana]|uniref:peroxisomal ATPase PEX1 isoform X2 n=1 Tax=Periplaneta americana TaxID=6978 RepID=UPI0037E7C870